MTEKGEVRKPVWESTVTAEAARRDLSDLLGRAAYRDERFVITYHGDEHAALIGPRDLERLRALDAA